MLKWQCVSARCLPMRPIFPVEFQLKIQFVSNLWFTKVVGPSVPGNSSLRGPNTSHCCKGLIKKSKFHVFTPCIDARPKCLTLPQPPPQVSVFTTLDGFLQRGHMEVFQTWRDTKKNHRATRPGTTFCMVANWLQHCLRSASYNGRPTPWAALRFFYL